MRSIKFGRFDISHIQTLSSFAFNPALIFSSNPVRRRFSRGRGDPGPPVQYREKRKDRLSIGAAALMLQSHNLWHRRGETDQKKKEGEGREAKRKKNGKKKQGVKGGRKINSKRTRGRQDGRARTLRYQREADGRGEQAFFMRFISLIK